MSWATKRATELCEELRTAHKPFNSPHEAYGVIAEELDEFWEEVRKKGYLRSRPAMMLELLQIAACAMRYADELKDAQENCTTTSPGPEIHHSI